MANSIETHLFQNGGTHALIALTIENNYLILKIAPWADLSKKKEFLFEQFNSLSVTSDSSINEGMPFDIIGVDSKNLPLLKWEFFIHCSEIDISFKAKWPIHAGLFH